MISQLELLEWTDDDGYGLRVEFVRSTDRWEHRIFGLQPATPACLFLSSSEGSPNDRWPPSPPLQELVIERQARFADPSQASSPTTVFDVAMLLGRAGSAHWSVSMELHREPTHLVVDVACRSGERPPFIGSTYHAAVLPEPRVDDQRRELIWRTHGLVSLRPIVGGLHQSSTKPTTIVVEPRLIASMATCRWSYSIEIEKPSPKIDEAA